MMNFNKLWPALVASLMLAASPVLAATNQLPAIQGPNGPVSADPVAEIGYDSVSSLPCVVGKTPTCQLQVNAAVTVTATATFVGFTPTSATSNLSGTASTSASAGAALPVGVTQVVENRDTANTLYIAFGTTGAISATTAAYPVSPGTKIVFTPGAGTFYSVITASSTAAYTISGGSGIPTLAGGGSGSGGGGGGAITAAASAFSTGYNSDLGNFSTSTACASDTAANCSLLDLVKRGNQRISAVVSALGSPFQAGGSIGNTSFGISGNLPAFASTPTVNLGTIGTAATSAKQDTIIANLGTPGVTPCATAITACDLDARAAKIQQVAEDNTTESPVKAAVNSYVDGALVTLGLKADAKSTATDTTPVTAMQVFKEISFMEQNPASRAVTNAGTFAVQAGASRKLISSTLTRIANTTAYSGSAGSPQAVCLFTSVTTCAPLTMTVSATNTVNGYITSLRLIKSTTGATGASFKVLAYQAAPTLTSTFDVTVYNPKLADLTSSPTAFVGYWTCAVAAQQVGADNSFYDCTSSTVDGHQSFQLTDGTLRFLVETTGAYAPGSGETFNVVADILASVP